MVPDDKEITIIDLLLFLKNYFLILCFLPLFITLFVYFGSSLIIKYYKSEITFFSSTSPSSTPASVPSIIMGRGGNPFENFSANDSNFLNLSELLNSRRLLITVAEKENIKDFYNTDTNKDAISFLKKNLEYIIDDETSMERISFKSKDPIFTKKILDSTFNEIEILNNAIFSQKASLKGKFFENKIKETIEKLNDSELLIYSSKFKDKAFISLDPKIEFGSRAKAYDTLRSLESELEVQKNLYGEDSLLIKQLKSKIKALEKNSNLNPIDKKQFDNLKEWREIYRDYMYHSAALRSHINNFELAKLEEASGTYLSILDGAQVLENPNYPNRKTISVFTLIISFFLTISFLVVYEFYVRLDESEKRKIFGG